MQGEDARAIGLAAMTEAGAEKAQANLRTAEKSELSVDAGRISLFRSTIETQLTLSAFIGGRKGSITVNRIDQQSVQSVAAEAVAAAGSSQPDPANDISPAQPARSFSYGERTPDRDFMYERLAAFLSRSARRYPKTRLEQCTLQFTRARESFANTNGAELSAETGIYSLSTIFTTKDGRKTSSLNYTGASRRRLDETLERWGSVDELMRQSTEQLSPGSVGGKFVGDVIITPDCLDDLIEYLVWTCLGDQALIKGTSPLRDSLGKVVASPLFTLRSCPVSPEIQHGYFFTPDGFPAQDSALIERGVLTAFNLSLYGSNKTGRPRAQNAGGCWVVDPGETALADMIASVDRGILLCRFSGGNPSDNGDFSGAAKNSYLIEGGKISRAVTETMLAGNLTALLLAISAVSRERVDYGLRVYPWVKAGGLTISGA